MQTSRWSSFVPWPAWRGAVALASLTAALASCGAGVSRDPLSRPRDGQAMETVITPAGPDGADVQKVDNRNGDAAPDVPASDDGPKGGSDGMTSGSGGAGGAAGAGPGTGGAAGPRDDAADTDGGIPDVPTERPAQTETRVDAPPCTSGFHAC